VKLPAGRAVGVASHTGSVRVHNEDDYLLGALLPGPPGLLLCAIADGMGGAVGGAEASRLALRALGARVLDGADPAPVEQRLRAGFQLAAARIAEQAASVPALRDMGTTLTALCLQAGSASAGHVGDTRLYRLRGGECVQLTTDHAVREPDNLLLRCLGGGQAQVEPDCFSVDLRAGDRFVLVSDGVWSAVPAAGFAALAARGEPQAAAEALVAAALRAGGPDNATAVVVDVRGPDGGAPVDAPLPREERPARAPAWPKPLSLRAPRWPWLLLVVAAAFVGLTVLRAWFDVDALAWLLRRR